MIAAFVIVLLLQDLPGMPGMQVPIQEVVRRGDILHGKATTLDGKPVEEVYLFHGRLSEISPGVTPYIVSFRASNLKDNSAIVEPGHLIASAPVRNGRFKMNLKGKVLPRSDLIMGTLKEDSVAAYPIDFAAKVNTKAAEWNGPDQLWMRIGIPLLGVLLLLTAWLATDRLRNKR